jgi:hypothetical protein
VGKNILIAAIVVVGTLYVLHLSGLDATLLPGFGQPKPKTP